MSKNSAGVELNQIARYLFGEAANKWYLAILLEITAGIFAAIFVMVTKPDWLVMAGVFGGTLLLVVSYSLRLWSDQQYGTAETMRRQSILTEALGWEISKTQMSKWRQVAGKSALDKMQKAPRDPDFYATDAKIGYVRLAEMTLESAFYTRHIYGKIKNWAWIIFASATGITALVIIAAFTGSVPDKVELIVAKVLFAIIPTALAIDVLGWAIKLGQMMGIICDIEESIEGILREGRADLPQVLRMVSEYNCQVVAGIPIHDRLFDRWHGEINLMWQKRQD